LPETPHRIHSPVPLASSPWKAPGSCPFTPWYNSYTPRLSGSFSCTKSLPPILPSRQPPRQPDARGVSDNIAL
jgi:hypothetical protein